MSKDSSKDYHYEEGRISTTKWVLGAHGNFFLGYINWEGKPISKDPHSHPYSFDEYVEYKKADKYKHAVYSDRLFQWNSEKYNKAAEKVWGNKSQYFNAGDYAKIEQFLQEYLEKHNLELIGILKGCNRSSGYPYWVFFFNEEKQQ